MAELLKSSAAVAWPFVVLLLILMFHRELRALLQSLTQRGLSLEIGGQKLTFDEVNKQQRNLIEDIQGQVVELRKLLGSHRPNASNDLHALAPGEPLATRISVLWVDDNPKNNSYLVQQLRDRGVVVELATSTAVALMHFEHKKFDVVISDMGRIEGATYNRIAGVALLRAIRARDSQVPIILFTSAATARDKRDMAIAEKATDITSSATELLAILERLTSRERGA